jgi:hypothetical protein
VYTHDSVTISSLVQWLWLCCCDVTDAFWGLPVYDGRSGVWRMMRWWGCWGGMSKGRGCLLWIR